MENTNHNGTSDMILLSVITIIHSSDVHSFIHSFKSFIHSSSKKKLLKKEKELKKKKKKNRKKLNIET